MSIKEQLIPCHTCERLIVLARSVRIRQNPNLEFKRMLDRWPDPNQTRGAERVEFNRALLQYQRNSKHRRAFICEQCYKLLDNHYGVGEILTPSGPCDFNLAGDSRAGKAAVYTVAKWRRYQRRLASSMGVSA